MQPIHLIKKNRNYGIDHGKVGEVGWYKKTKIAKTANIVINII